MLYASSALLLVLFAVRNVVLCAENDTKVVGSYIHEKKIKAPSDLLGSASKKYSGSSHDDGDEGFFRSKATKDKDGYNKFDTYNHKDGDAYGYEQHFEFGNKGGDKKNGGYHETSDFDDDEAAGSTNPKYTEWHFEENSDSPAKYYRFESDGKKGSKGKLVGPDYQSKKSKKRPKRKKELDAEATEYDNYETYGDIEEADDGAPADFYADDGDPEYGNVYADAEAYDYD